MRRGGRLYTIAVTDRVPSGSSVRVLNLAVAKQSRLIGVQFLLNASNANVENLMGGSLAAAFERTFYLTVAGRPVGSILPDVRIPLDETVFPGELVTLEISGQGNVSADVAVGLLGFFVAEE